LFYTNKTENVCIPDSFVCNGYPDCENAEDQLNCTCERYLS